MAHITDVIKYEGDNSTFIWKHPCEDFNDLTQLVVHESQEAIFFLNGQALDLFGPGRYTLETGNIPQIGKLLNRTSGGKSPFHCEVYFINKTVQMSIKWGTDSKVRFIDPLTDVPLEIGACGELNLMVSDSRKLLVKLVGTTRGIAWGENGTNFTKSIQNSFKPLISMAVRTNLTYAIKSKGIDLLEIDEHLEDISKILKEKIEPGFEEYGLAIPQFYLSTVLLPEDDPNFRKIRELHTISLQKRVLEAQAQMGAAKAESEAAIIAAQRAVELERQATETEITKRQLEREIIEAKAMAEAAKAEAEKTITAAQADSQATRLQGLAEAEVMAAKGYTQRDVIQADVQKAYAESLGNIGSGGNSVNIGNTGTGSGGSGGSGMMNDIMGLGVGMAAASVMSGQVGEMMKSFASLNQPNNNTQAAPQTKAPEILCPKCNKPLPENAKFCLECGERILPSNSIICPECSNVVTKGKFCPECGHRFVMVCPKCGIEISNAKFCPECGEKL